MGNAKCCNREETKESEIQLRRDIYKSQIPNKNNKNSKLNDDIDKSNILNQISLNNISIDNNMIKNNQPNIQNQKNVNITHLKQNKFSSSTPTLQITVINSTTLQIGSKIKITPDNKIQNSLRKNRQTNDNIIYFGYNDPKCKNNNNLNDPNISDDSVDFSIPPNETICHSTNAILSSRNNNIIKTNEVEKQRGRFFQIYFDNERKGYFIRDLGNGLGTFIKIKDSIILNDNSLINIGDSYLVININSDTQELIIKIYDQKKDNDINIISYNYYPKKNNDNLIKIGRKNHGNDIEIEDSHVSKVNCNIIFDNKIGWVLRDGNEIIGINGEKHYVNSTNGTWFLAIQNFRIYEGMLFKGQFNVFCCNFIKENF